jgi:hypothetical protein
MKKIRATTGRGKRKIKEKIRTGATQTHIQTQEKEINALGKEESIFSNLFTDPT